jgi:hypothetical protein
MEWMHTATLVLSSELQLMSMRTHRQTQLDRLAAAAAMKITTFIFCSIFLPVESKPISSHDLFAGAQG